MERQKVWFEFSRLLSFCSKIFLGAAPEICWHECPVFEKHESRHGPDIEEECYILILTSYLPLR